MYVKEGYVQVEGICQNTIFLFFFTYFCVFGLASSDLTMDDCFFTKDMDNCFSLDGECYTALLWCIHDTLSGIFVGST